MARATAQFFVPCPWGLGEWQKRANVIKSQLQGQFQRFLNQTLCVFSQMKDIKHLRREFHSVDWVMPHGWDFGVMGSKIKFSEHGHETYQIKVDDQ